MAKKLDELSPGKMEDVLLTPEEMLALEAEAQEEFKAERKAQQAADFKEATKKRLAKKELLKNGEDAEGPNVEEVVINLAPHAPWIALDGRFYFNGQKYKFDSKQLPTIQDLMFQTWRHEKEIGNGNVNAYNGTKSFNHSLSDKG